MSDETINRFSEFDVMAALHQRLASKATETSSTRSSTGKTVIDPYQMMLARKEQNKEKVPSPVQRWPDKDIKKLEEFCRQHGIMGFNCGIMSPLAALALLKQKLGVIDPPVQTERYGPNYPYTETMKKRMILHG